MAGEETNLPSEETKGQRTRTSPARHETRWAAMFRRICKEQKRSPQGKVRSGNHSTVLVEVRRDEKI